MRMKHMGCKKIELTEEQKEYILDQTLKGTDTITICKVIGISEMAFYQVRKRDPLFDKEFKEIRVESAHIQVERLRTIADDCETMPEVLRARLQSDNIKWEASKRVPEVYGDSLNLNVNHTVDLAKVLLDAAERTIPFLEMRQALQIDRVVTETTDEHIVQASQVIDKIETHDDE